jgi:hypothetical protein
MKPEIVCARLRGPWQNDALPTPISGLPEIGAQIRAGRVNSTCVDRYSLPRSRISDAPFR